MWFRNSKNEVTIQADVKNGLHIVSRIMPHSQGVREVAIMCTPTSLDTYFEKNTTLDTCGEGNTNINYQTSCYTVLTTGESEFLHEDGPKVQEFCNATVTISQREKSQYYELMHRRFGHMGPDQLRNIHKVTKLKRRILVPAMKSTCRVCKLTKLRNRTNKTLNT